MIALMATDYRQQ